MLHVELTPTNNLQSLKRVIGSLIGAIHLRVDIRLSKIMVMQSSPSYLPISNHTFQVKGFVGAPVVTNALKEAGFGIVTSELAV